MSDPFSIWLKTWELIPDGDPFTTPHTKSRLLPVRRDGEPAILKLPGNEDERRGAELMEWYAGNGAARVLARHDGVLLLERLEGAENLTQMARSGFDDDATRILCRTAKALHAPRGVLPPKGLIPLDIWCRALEPAALRHGGLFVKAAAVLQALLYQPANPVVLHGDLHHGNVLDGGDRGWLAIDPKAVMGDPAFDYANLFRNPDIETALGPGAMERRAKIVASETGFDVSSILRWVLAYAGLGAAWSLESGEDPTPGLDIVAQSAAQLGI